MILNVHVCFYFFTGGNDKNAVVFNKDTEQVMAILKGHSKKVTSVIYHPEDVSH
jgi:pre-mRNA-processing factor 19